MLIAYKYRIYPNAEQRKLIFKTFGCSRFVYNYYLALKKETYETEGKLLSKIDCNNHLNKVVVSKVFLNLNPGKTTTILIKPTSQIIIWKLTLLTIG